MNLNPLTTTSETIVVNDGVFDIKAPCPGANTIAEAVCLIVGSGNVTELRALDARLKCDRFLGTLSGYYDDFDKLARDAASIHSAKGIYLVANPVNAALLARAHNRLRRMGKGDASTSDGDVVRRRWLLIDADAVRPSGISATDGEHDAALERCRKLRTFLDGRGWPEPLVADSGNGGHLLYRIDLPADDGGLVERCLRALAHRFDDGVVTIDTTVHNPARIWKLYGTMACKGDNTAERPHRLSSILHVPNDLDSVIVTDERLQALAAEVVAPEHPRRNHERSEVPTFDLETFIQRHLPGTIGPEPWKDGQRWVLPICPWNPEHTDGAAYIVRHGNGAIAHGCHHNGCNGKAWADLRTKFEPAVKQRTSIRSSSPASQRKSAPAPYRLYPLDCLPSVLKRYAKAVAQAMRTDTACVALAVLTTCAAAIGTTRAVRLKRRWCEVALLWAVIVAEQGSGKSPPMREAMRPLIERQRLELDRYAQAMAQYQEELADYQREVKRYQFGSEGEPPAKPEPPVAVRHVISDTTMEALAPILKENPRGVLLDGDELAGWFGQMDRYTQSRQGDAAQWRRIFDGHPITIDRKTSRQIIHVDRPAVSIMGTIQPQILKRSLGIEHQESGMAARFLVANPPQRPVRWSEFDISAAAEQRYEQVISGLLALVNQADPEERPSPVIVVMTEEARQRFIAWHDSHRGEQVDLSGVLSGHWSKLVAICARLALILALVRYVSGESEHEIIELVDVEAAIALAEWHKHEARRVYAMLGETEEDQATRRLVELIERKGGAVTVREWQRVRHHKSAGDAEAELKQMKKDGLGVWETGPTNPHGGAPATVFRLSGTVTGDTTPENPEKNEVLSPVTPSEAESPTEVGSTMTAVVPPADDADLAVLELEVGREGGYL